MLQLFERAILPPAHVERFVLEQAPDVFMASPLVAVGSVQADYLRAAKRLGIRTVYPVLSWDNLTTKGLVRDVPDLTLVWNEGMADEARSLHGIPTGRIRVVGSTAWDHWFDWAVRRSRDEFCHEVGLPADRPFVLYVGSSWWVVADEVDFVRRWVAALRGHGGLLADIGVLVRPHPQRDSSEWGTADLGGEALAVWPRFGEEPVGDGPRQNYFESIYHSAAVFGISTSAQIEAAIVGRPVHTLITDEFRGTQVGTAHFKHLEDERSSMLVIARSFEEHAELLERSLRGELPDRNDDFVRMFVRPHGLDVPATPLYVEAIEELAAAPAPEPDGGPLLAPILRFAMLPLRRLAVRDVERRRASKPESPERELKTAIRRLSRAPRPVVAGPWAGDETGELLYWIPFLHWAENATFGLADRLCIIAPLEDRAWYAGFRARLVTPEEAAALDGEPLPADPIVALRPQLSAQTPAARLQRRLLDFVPLAAPGAAGGPADRLRRSCLCRRRSCVHGRHAGRARPRYREAAVAVIAAARCLAGDWGPSALVASLTGVPAVVVGEVPTDGLRLATSFLSRPPFAPIEVATEEEAAAAVARLSALYSSRSASGVAATAVS